MLPAVVRHLVTYQVGLPVKSFGALVTLVLPLLTVRQHVLLQAVETGTRLSETWVYREKERERRGYFIYAWCFLPFILTSFIFFNALVSLGVLTCLKETPNSVE